MPLPAASNEVLFNFEENIEKAAAAVINALGLTAMKARGGEEPSMVVAVEFTLGEATGTMAIRPGTANPPRKEYSEYLGTLEIQLKANRPDVAASGTAGIDDNFSEARAKIRVAFMESEWPLNDANLIYYRLSRLRPIGAVNGVGEADEQNVSTLRYDVKFSILKEAWPTGS